MAEAAFVQGGLQGAAEAIEPQLLEDARPVSRDEAIAHATGVAAYLVGNGYALTFLYKNRQTLRDDWFIAPLGFALGTIAADSVSGLLHWSFDTWFDDDVRLLGRVVHMSREHHVRPARLLRLRLRDQFGMSAGIGSAVALPIYFFTHLRGDRLSAASKYARVLTGFTVANELAMVLEYHKSGHRDASSPVVKVLQQARLVLSPATHRTHHGGAYDTNYCLITGVGDRTLGRLGLFRALEASISRLTGRVPRIQDDDWGLKYGRPDRT